MGSPALTLRPDASHRWRWRRLTVHRSLTRAVRNGPDGVRYHETGGCVPGSSLPPAESCLCAPSSLLLFPIDGSRMLHHRVAMWDALEPPGCHCVLKCVFETHEAPYETVVSSVRVLGVLPHDLRYSSSSAVPEAIPAGGFRMPAAVNRGAPTTTKRASIVNFPARKSRMPAATRSAPGRSASNFMARDSEGCRERGA